MTEHARFTVATGIPVFFCDPHSPWQRGTNENTNALLRQDMVMLTERPPEAEDRAVPGHWEGDLIMGAGNASAIITLVERASRYTILQRVPHDHTAIRVAALRQVAMGRLPSLLKRSLAWDQGRERVVPALSPEEYTEWANSCLRVSRLLASNSTSNRKESR